MYNAVESRVSKEVILSKWQKIVNEINAVEARGELLIPVGDFNSAIGNLVKDNKSDRFSIRGNLIKDLVNSNDYVLVNSLDKKVCGGPYTRGEHDAPENKSVLDLFIISKDFEKYVEVLKIDDKHNFTPFRITTDSKVVYSDHYGIVLKLKGIPVQ